MQSRLLATGHRHFFKDSPNPAVPAVAAGVYTIWNEDTLSYVGMAGHSLTSEDIVTQRRDARRSTELFSRVNSHTSVRRSGDQFCVYVSDRLVLPTLSRGELREIADGALSLDIVVRDYIRQHLSYRFVETKDGITASQGVWTVGTATLTAADW